MSVKTVGAFMTRVPETIGADQTLEEAHRVMRSRRIRHLPVLRRGRLVGVVTQRDLMLIESLPDVDPAEVPVEDAMSRRLYVARPSSPLAIVARDMAERKLGSAIVVDGARVVGVFTVTDACRALADVLSVPRRRRA